MKRTVPLAILVSVVGGMAVTSGIVAGCGHGTGPTTQQDLATREQSLEKRMRILQQSGGRWEAVSAEDQQLWLGLAGGDLERARNSFLAEYEATAGGTKKM